MLQHQQQLLIENVEAWNEQELTQNFIGSLLSLVKFSQFYRFNLFSERNIEATIPNIQGDIKLSGGPDNLVAAGYWTPEIPMFAFSEYKRRLDPTDDPASQSLAAMLVGQHLNEQPQPLYGCYVIGYIKIGLTTTSVSTSHSITLIGSSFSTIICPTNCIFVQ